MNKKEEEIIRLKEEHETLNSRIDEMDKLKNILNHKGKTLEKDVSKILSEILDIEINFEEDGDGDIILSIDNVKYIIETKGVSTSIKKSHVAQLIQHVSAEEDNDIEMGNTFEYKGVLMINPYIDRHIKDRVKENYYDPRIENEINRNDFCAIDIPTLLGIYSRFLKKEVDKQFLIDKLNKKIYIEHDYLIE